MTCKITSISNDSISYIQTCGNIVYIIFLPNVILAFVTGSAWA